MTTIEGLLQWESQKLEQLTRESGDIAKLVNVFREFLETVGDERQRFANERNVLLQQSKVVGLNSEQRCSEMQQQIYELSGKLHNEAQHCADLVKDGAITADELSSLKEKIEVLESEKIEMKSQLQSFDRESTDLRLKLEDSLRRLHYKEEELKRLSGEWESVSEREAQLSKLQAEARAKLSDVESREVSLKFREDRLSQEKDIVAQQNTWLADELTAKTNDLSKLRQSSTEAACKLRSDLAEKTEEATFLNASQKTLKAHATKLEKRVGELVSKLQDKDSCHLGEIENMRLQLNKQEKLANLYNANCDEYQTKIKQLTTAIGEMQVMLKQAQEDNVNLEQHCTEEANKHAAEMKELECKITSQQNELEHANDLILNTKKSTPSATGDSSQFDISQLSSTAVTVGGMLKSGMTIVQMYSAYVESSEALALEKDKNRIQAQYLDQILKEIEEKAPLLQQQRTDYENALLNQDSLAEKLEKSIAQVEHYRIAGEESQNASRALKRESERFKAQIKDLNQQIQVLLLEVEDARAGRVSRLPSQQPPTALDSSQVISDQLVSFRSVAELQQQNSKLLCIVRELSEEQERRETEDEDPKIIELRAKLESADGQIKELKVAQQRQVEMVEAVARQRDMYRVLLAQAGHNLGPCEERREQTTKEDESNKYEMALGELQKEFTAYKVEKKDQLAKVQEQLDTARLEHSAMLAEKTRLASKLEFAEEKHKIVESSYTTTSAEMKQYKDKNNELSSSILKLQFTNDRLQNENAASRDEVSKLRSSLESERRTSELLRVNEIKQHTHSEALARESRTSSMLLSNIQTIHNNMERQEFERKEHTNKKIEMLESELSEARRKLQSTELRFKTAEAIQNTQNRELKSNLEKERKAVQERQVALDSLQESHNSLLAETAELKSQLETSQYNATLASQGLEKSTPSSDTDIEGTITVQAKRMKEQSLKLTELQHKLIEMSAREDSLKAQADLAKQHAQQYKGISEAHELALKELTQSEQSVKSASEELLSQNTHEISTLTEKLHKANEEREQLEKALEDTREKGFEEIKELNTALTKTQHQLEKSRENEEAARALEEDVKIQFKKLDILYEESQNSLTEQRDRCILLETEIDSLKKEVSELEGGTTQLKEGKANAERQLQADSGVWTSEKRSLEQERDNLQQRADDLTQQNALLHSQLATLTKDVVELQQAVTTEQPLANTSDSQSDKSTEELWEIIRYVRREKDILSTKMEVTESQALRFKDRCCFLEKQIEQTRACLEEERNKTDSTVMSQDQHQDMLQKVEEAEALSERVKLLSEEKTKLTTMTSLLKQQIAAYEKQVKPLKTKNKELMDRVTELQTEKEGLKKDVSRWSTRTNELVEQCNKVDAKEFARLQSEHGKLKIQMKKTKDDHAVELTTLQEKVKKTEEEGGRVSEEKRQLLSTINSMKAEGTKVRIELSNVSAELKTATAQVSQQKTELEKLKKDNQEMSKEVADTNTAMEEQRATDEKAKSDKDNIIQKLRALAKKYKSQVQAQATSGESERKSEESRSEDQEKLRKAMDGMRMAKQKIDALTVKNKELETAVSESNSNTNMLKDALEGEKSESAARVEELTSANAALQLRIHQAEQQLASLADQLEAKSAEIAQLSERTNTSHAETNTDIPLSRLDHHTNTEDTPTASVKPTTIIGLSTPTAAVRPTSIAPDPVARTATIAPTNAVHISTSSSSHVIPHMSTASSSNTTTQVSSSSVQSESQETTTGEVRAILRSSPRSRREEVSSAAGIKRTRTDVDDEEEPGPSTKIAMVTSSAHVQHDTEVSQSTPIFGLISSASSSSPAKHSGKHSSGKHSAGKHSVVSSSAEDGHPASSSRPRDHSADVSSSEAGALTERQLESCTTNEATPAVSPRLATSLETDEQEETEEEENALIREEEASVPVIEINSDSEGSSSGISGDEEAVYSGFEEIEEDSRQLQFSFVQSSGADPVMDILSEPEEQMELFEGSEEPSTTTTEGGLVRSLRSGDTPWAHLAASSSPSNTESSQAAPSSSSNIRSIRRIKRQPPKKD